MLISLPIKYTGNNIMEDIPLKPEVQQIEPPVIAESTGNFS
jgi:hypothetical protein